MNKIAQAEFRGFFWGEGCLDIGKCYSKKRKQFFYRPRIRIGMNIKEKPLMIEIQKNIGGWISFRKQTNSINWDVLGKKKLERVLKILNNGILNAHKKKELEIFKKSVNLIPIQGKKYTTKMKRQMEKYYLNLRELKHAS